MLNCSCKLTYRILAPLKLNTEFFLSLDNEDKMSSKRRVVNLVSLLFLLSSITIMIMIMVIKIRRRIIRIIIMIGFI